MKYQSTVEAFKLERYNVNDLLNRGVRITEKADAVTGDPLSALLIVEYKGEKYNAFENDYVVVLEDRLLFFSSELFHKLFKECDEVQGKTLNNSTVNTAKQQVKDIEVYGDGDTFRLLCKASSKNEGWMKSTKVCNVAGGCIVQVTTQQRNNDGSYAIAEALTFVPGNKINIDVEPRRIERIPLKELTDEAAGIVEEMLKGGLL